jgi:hypothetical protein
MIERDSPVPYASEKIPVKKPGSAIMNDRRSCEPD